MEEIMKKNLCAVIAALSLSLLLGGCGGASKSTFDYAVAETTAASYDYSTAKGAVTALPEAASALEATSEITSPNIQGRKLIRTVDLSVETDSFDTLIKDLQAQINDLSGYVEQSDISGSSMRGNQPTRRRAWLTARIPSDSLDQFVATVEDNSNVTNRSESTNDVTLQYSDLESRKKTLTIEQERIWALLEKADTLEAVIALEERLSEVRYELESMESQLRNYDNRVDYSTVNINIEEVTVYTPVAPETVGERIRNGFAQNMKQMKEFLTDVFVDLISKSPIWIPLLLFIAVVWKLLKLLFAGLRKKKTIRQIVSGIPVDLPSLNPEASESGNTENADDSGEWKTTGK